MNSNSLPKAEDNKGCNEQSGEKSPTRITVCPLNCGIDSEGNVAPSLEEIALNYQSN